MAVYKRQMDESLARWGMECLQVHAALPLGWSRLPIHAVVHVPIVDVVHVLIRAVVHVPIRAVVHVTIRAVVHVPIVDVVHMC